MALCADLRIPRSHFLGGPLVWTDQDRAEALAYKQYLRSLCPSCGTDPTEWFEHDTDDAGEPLFDEEGEPVVRPKMVAPFVVSSEECLTCIEIDRAVERDRTGSGPGGSSGKRYSVARWEAPDDEGEVTDFAG